MEINRSIDIHSSCLFQQSFVKQWNSHFSTQHWFFNFFLWRMDLGYTYVLFRFYPRCWNMHIFHLYSIRGLDMFWFKSQCIWKLFWKTSPVYNQEEFWNMSFGFTSIDFGKQWRRLWVKAMEFNWTRFYKTVFYSSL